MFTSLHTHFTGCEKLRGKLIIVMLGRENTCAMSVDQYSQRQAPTPYPNDISHTSMLCSQARTTAGSQAWEKSIPTSPACTSAPFHSYRMVSSDRTTVLSFSKYQLTLSRQHALDHRLPPYEPLRLPASPTSTVSTIPHETPRHRWIHTHKQPKP